MRLLTSHRNRARLAFEMLERRDTPSLAFGFASAFGSSGSDFGAAITTDSAGNSYVAGSFVGTVDFDPGPGTANLTSAGGHDIFLCKFDSAGGLLWARQFGSPSNDLTSTDFDSVDDVLVDANGNVYFVGYFVGTADFDPGASSHTLTSAGQGDGFVCTLDSAGNYVSALRIGGTLNDGCSGIEMDSAGNLYVTGDFWGTIDADPGPGQFNVSSVGDTDGYIAKLDSNGTLLWAGRVGGPGHDNLMAVALDSSNNVWLSGRFRQSGDFDPGPGSSTLTSAGGYDAFVVKLSSSGTLLLAERVGSTGDDVGSLNGLRTDSAGNVYFAGSFQGTADFDPGSGTANLVSAGGSDAFILKLDNAGGYVWAGALGGSGSDRAFGLALDSSANVYVTGQFQGSGDFDPGAALFQLTGAGSQTAFVAQFDANRNFIWAGAMAANGGAGEAIDVDSFGNVYTTGLFAGTADFDPGLGTANRSSVGGNDAYLSKLVPLQAGVSILPPTVSATEGGSTSYSVALTAAPVSPVTVSLNPGSQVTVTPATLVFTSSNWDVVQSVTVTAVEDFIAQGAHLASIGHFVSSGDNGYNGIAVASVVVNIVDNDVAGVNLTSMAVNLTEGSNPGTYAVSLNSQPLSNVTIVLHTDNQLAGSPTTLVFTALDWNTGKPVSVSAVDDAVIEGAHTGIITHTIVTGDSVYAGLAAGTVTATITDNDFPGLVLSPAGGTLAILEGGTRSYTARLNYPPTADVTVTLDVDPELTVSASTLLFTPANWNVPQMITVTALGNDFGEGNRAAIIDHSIASADPLYGSGSATSPSMTVEIFDDDNALVVNGTASTDVITVMFSPNVIQVVLNSKATFYPAVFGEVLIFGGGGNDKIRLLNPSLPAVVLGEDGTDILRIDGPAAANVFSVDATSATVNGVPIAMLDLESLELVGNLASDELTVQATPSFKVSFQGAGGSDALQGPDEVSLWKIMGPSAGTLNQVMSFSSVENLHGGSADDTFLFAAGKTIAGTVDGGSGANTLDYSAYRTPITANLDKGTITGARGFAGVSTLIGSSALDRLIGANGSNTWNITAPNTGTVGTLTFASFENITGGSSDDTFSFATGALIKGKLDGGLGIDTLDYGNSSTVIQVNLQMKTATGMAGWLGLERFLGGTGTDRLIGANRASTWAFTGTGAGTITGGIAFQSFENIVGGTFADIFDLGNGGEWLGLLDGNLGIDTLISDGTYILTSSTSGNLNGRSFRGIETRR